MNAIDAAPTSLEHDTQHINARDGHVSPGDIAIGVVIGRTSEFFDFFVYAIASVLVFPRLVFPNVAPIQATLDVFAIFALGFFARPIGTWFFLMVDRRYGRIARMIMALFLLGTATVMVAFLPSYNQIGGAAAILLAALRIGQGIAWGGTWDGLPSLLALNAPETKRGWYAMIPQLGALIGLFIASALFTYFLTHLSAADFLDWGWRYPFFVAFALNVVALFARLRIVSTAEYTALFETRELQPTSMRDTVRNQGRTIFIGAFAPLASFSLFHMVTIFPLSWVFLFSHHNPARFLGVETVGAAIGVLCIVFSGKLADIYGRRMILGVTAIGIAAFSGFAPQLLGSGQTGEITYMLFGFILLGLSFGQASGVVASSFPAHYRYTGSAITSDLAWLFGAGFAPFAALWLSSHFGLVMAGAYLLSGAIGTGAALVINKTLAAKESEFAEKNGAG